MGALTVSINNISVMVYENSFQLDDSISSLSTLMFRVRDDTGLNHFSKGMPVSISDSVNGLLYTGFVLHAIEDRASPNILIKTDIDVQDNHYLASKRTYDGAEFTSVPAGIILVQLLNALSAEGVTAQYAAERDTTAAQFNTGTLTGVAGASNVDDGDLELSLAGSVVSYTDSSLSLSPTVAIKLTGYASQGFNNSYCYREIWSGSQLIASGDAFTYDVWISSTSPAIVGGMDFVCTDGTTFRDSNLVGTDQQGLGSHPSTDLAGLANDQWYTRSCGVSGALIGKTIAYATVVFEGEATGNYTMYIRNAKWFNGGTTKTHFFDSTQNTLQSNKQLQIQGYSKIAIAVVNTYDKTATQTVGPHSISAAAIVQSSQFNWAFPALLDSVASIAFQTSIDGGATYQAIANHASIPNLLPGMSVGSQNLYYQCILTCGVDPTLPPSVSAITIAVNPSYAAIKTDVISTTTTQANFNAGTKTNTKSINPNGLTNNGFTKAFSSTTDYNGTTTVFGNSANEFLFIKALQLQALASFDARSRLDFAGTWQNFTAEVDIQVPGSGGGVGLEYRTTNFGNSLDSYAYSATVNLTTVLLGRGTNSTGAGSFTSVATGTIFNGLVADSWHHLKIVINGSNHQIFLDDVLYVNATDATYSTAGNISLRYYNSAASQHQAGFANFGVVSNLVGTWVSPVISLAAATNYGASVVEWDASQIPSTAIIGAETTINGGSTWQAVTNGGSISGLTLGQSLAAVNLQIRMTLTAANASFLPILNGVTAWILGQYSASGNRVSPALPLVTVGRLGGSVVSWNANLPSGCTLGVDVGTPSENSYGITNGLNPGTAYPVTARLSPQIVTWAKADGHDNFRFQLDISSMWRVQSDTTGGAGWDFAPLDDAMSKLTAAGFTITFPIRGMPDWSLANPTYQATDEPWFMPDPNDVLTACKVIAARYNGVFNIPSYGPMKLHKLEVGNEEYNIHFTKATLTVTLAQAVNSGTSYSTVNISASTLAVPNGVWMQFGTSGGAGNTVKLTSALNIGDTVVHIAATGGGTYTATANAANGSAWTVVYRGIRTSPYAIYDGHLGVLQSASPTPQPARDPWFLQQVLNTVGPVMRANFPTLRIGAGAIWWMWDDNYTDFILGLGSAVQWVEYVNFHYYSNANDPHVGSGHVPSITTAINNIYNALVTIGYGSTAIESTEFGWQMYKINTTATATIAAGSRTITPASITGITTSIPLLIDEGTVNVETVTPSAVSGGTFTATFANSHSGTWTIGGNGDASEAQQATNYSNFLNDVKATGKCRRVYLFTYSDSHLAGNNSSLYLWNGSTFHQQAALAVLRPFIVANPLITTGFGTWTDITASNGAAIPGLTAQGSPTFDTFGDTGVPTYVMRAFGSTLTVPGTSAGNYTNTNITGGSLASWTYDTAHSRIAASGGNGGLYIRNSVSVADVDIYYDSDLSDFGGCVWRYQDTGNYYELAARDASSPVPSSVQVFKVIGGIRSNIGTVAIPITWIRGTYRRIRVSMIGTQITVYVDGQQIEQFTDLAISAAGLCGLRSDLFSGASAARFYQFNIQPIGQDVSTISIQTRLRLASTNPAATPQVLDLNVALFGTTIQAGSIIPQTAYFHQYIDKCIDDLAKQSNYWWYIDKNKVLYFLPMNGMPAPWIASDGGIPVTGLASGDFLDAKITVEDSSDLYRNRTIIDNVLAPVTINENRKGDSTATSWTFGDQWAGAPTITVNGVKASVGVKNVDSGKQFYYAVGDETITEDASGPLYDETFTINFAGPGQYLTYSQNDNLTEQAALAAIDGTSGIVTITEDGTGLTKAQGDALALARNAFYSVRGRLLKATTRRYGLAPGQLVSVFLPDHNIFDELFLVRQVSTTITTEGPTGATVQQPWMAVEAISGPDIGSWEKLYQRQ